MLQADQVFSDVSGATDILVCDLDKTLISVNSFPLFVRFALKTAVVKGLFQVAIKLCAVTIRRRLGISSHISFKRDVDQLTRELPASEIEHWVTSLLYEHAWPWVERMLSDWKGTKILCTAAPSGYAASIGRKLGFDQVITSRHHDGAYINNEGVVKLQSLFSNGVRSAAIGITDDPVLDAAMLSICVKRMLVSSDGSVSVLSR